MAMDVLEGEADLGHIHLRPAGGELADALQHRVQVAAGDELVRLRYPLPLGVYCGIPLVAAPVAAELVGDAHQHVVVVAAGIAGLAVLQIEQRVVHVQQQDAARRERVGAATEQLRVPRRAEEHIRREDRGIHAVRKLVDEEIGRAHLRVAVCRDARRG